MTTIWITAKNWWNSYSKSGNLRTLKNSKLRLNVLRVFQRKQEKLVKVGRKIIDKRRSSPNAYVGVVVLEIPYYRVSTVGKCQDTRGMVGTKCVRWFV